MKRLTVCGCVILSVLGSIPNSAGTMNGVVGFFIFSYRPERPRIEL